MACDCELSVDPDDPSDDWHYLRACPSCGREWRALHCPHDGVQTPCPHCGVRPARVEE
jgi:predicted RNA-binding Zn-ribbon protein involved in translation (DUF1610 family)